MKNETTKIFPKQLPHRSHAHMTYEQRLFCLFENRTSLTFAYAFRLCADHLFVQLLSLMG